MKPKKIIIEAAMLPTLFIGVSSVMAGAALVIMESKSVEGEIKITPLLLCLLFALMAQLSANFIFAYNNLHNNYGTSDTEHLADRLRRKEEPDMYAYIRMLGGVSVLFALTIGVVLINLAGIWALLLGSILVILIYLAVLGPMPLLLTPFGPLIYYLVAGPIGVVGTFLMEFHESSFAMLNWFDMVPVLLMGLAVGFPAATVRVTVEYQWYYQTLRSHKSSVVTELGRKGARWLVLINGFAMWGVFMLMLYHTSFTYSWVDMIFPTIALAGNVVVWRMMGRYSSRKQGLKPTSLALINLAVLCLGTLILYMCGGAPVCEI